MQEQQKLELIDIYDIVYEPWWLSFWFRVSVGLVLGLAVLMALYYWYRRRRARQIPLTYSQQALQQLQILEQQGFADGAQFYSSLTHLLKNYLQHRYAVALVDKTDTEVVVTLKTLPDISPATFKDVQTVFEGLMFIKFANQQAAKERMERDLQTSKSVIKSTLQDQSAKA